MGSFKYFKTAKFGGQPPGKIDASLNEKLKNIEWGEYKIGDLFDKLDLKRINKNKFDKNKDLSETYSKDFDLPLVNAKNGNNGIMYYARSADYESAEMSLDIVNDGAISVGNVYAQPQKTGVLYNAYLVKPKHNEIAKEKLLFLASCLEKSIKRKFSYDNKAGWNKVKMELICLPLSEEKTIDFDFMENFIAELEAERVAELEAYLRAGGLKDTTLTPAEQKAIKEYNSLEFKKFNIAEIFDIYNTSNILKRNIQTINGTIPYLCASSDNNAVDSYIEYDREFLSEGNCIFIAGKTFVVTYQEKDFFSNDSHNLSLYLKGKNRTKLNQLYLATCIFRSLNHKYSWGDSISKTKIRKDVVSLPKGKYGEPDFSLMETFISAIQKLVIKDVVEYSDNKISATKEVITKNKRA